MCPAPQHPLTYQWSPPCSKLAGTSKLPPGSGSQACGAETGKGENGQGTPSRSHSSFQSPPTPHPNGSKGSTLVEEGLNYFLSNVGGGCVSPPHFTVCPFSLHCPAICPGGVGHGTVVQDQLRGFIAHWRESMAYREHLWLVEGWGSMACGGSMPHGGVYGLWGGPHPMKGQTWPVRGSETH